MRRNASALLIAVVAEIVASNLVQKEVYASVGLDPDRAVAAVRRNEHRKSMLRNSCVHLMDFLSEAGLLNRPAMAIYRRVNMI